MLVRDLVPLFVNWCALHRSPATHRFYQLGLRVFAAKLGEREITELRQHEIESVLIEAGKAPDGSLYAPDTRRRNIISVQRLQEWSLTNRYLEKPIVGKLEKPAGRKRDRIPTDAETRAIVAAAPADFRVIYGALRLCGARPNELCRATVADWKRAEGIIELAEHKTAKKTGKPRKIPVGKKLAAVLIEAIGDRTEGPILLRANGKPWTTQTLSGMFRRLRVRAGLPRDLVLYLTRHEHGTKLLAQVKDLKAVAEALGHSDIKTTQRYTHKTTTELRTNQDLVELDGPAAEPEKPEEKRAA